MLDRVFFRRLSISFIIAGLFYIAPYFFVTNYDFLMPESGIFILLMVFNTLFMMCCFVVCLKQTQFIRVAFLFFVLSTLSKILFDVDAYFNFIPGHVDLFFFFLCVFIALDFLGFMMLCFDGIQKVRSARCAIFSLFPVILMVLSGIFFVIFSYQRYFESHAFGENFLIACPLYLVMPIIILLSLAKNKHFVLLSVGDFFILCASIQLSWWGSAHILKD